MTGSSLAVSVFGQLTLNVAPSMTDCWMRHLPRITVYGARSFGVACPCKLWTHVLHKIFNRSGRSVCHFKLLLVVWIAAVASVDSQRFLVSEVVFWFDVAHLPLTSSSSTSSWLITLMFFRTVDKHLPLVLVYKVLKNPVVWLARGECKNGRDRHGRSSTCALDVGRRFRWSFLSPTRGTEQRVSRCNIEFRVGGPCQDADEGFGKQEESEVVALLNCEFTSYCSQGINTAGQFPQTSSVVMWTLQQDGL